MAKLKKSPPWHTYYKEIEALFGYDPDIQILYDEDGQIIKIYVEKEEKASALDKLMPGEVKLGNITLKIVIIPGNVKAEGATEENIFIKAFAGNPVVSFIEETHGIFPATYVVFENEVVQYYDDNIADYHRLQSTLYQDIARRVFPDAVGVYFCTDIPNDEEDEQLEMIFNIDDVDMLD